MELGPARPAIKRGGERTWYGGTMRIVRDRRGVRVLHGRHLVSALPASPGPTGSVFDVLAAAVALLAPPARPVALLGFAAGGIVAPLRAAGFRGPIRAADLDVAPVPHFRAVAGAWAGRVTVDEAEAAAWLAARRTAFGAIVDDLSVQVPGDVTKPAASIRPLPTLARARLAPGGVAVVNWLPVKATSHMTAIETVAAPHAAACVITPDGYENRVVVAARALPDPRELGRRLRAALHAMGSPLARGLRVRGLVRRGRAPLRN